MKDNLFEILLHLFEKTLTKLREENNTKGTPNINTNKSEHVVKTETSTQLIAYAKETSLRVFTLEEKLRLTKASYQFLMQMLTWKVIAPEIIELVLNQLILSESPYITLEETKWTIKNILAESLSEDQLAFLDLVLYHKEDNILLQ